MVRNGYVPEGARGWRKPPETLLGRPTSYLDVLSTTVFTEPSLYARLINEMMCGLCRAKQCLPLKRISKFPDALHTHNPSQSYAVLINSHWEWNTRVKIFRLLQSTWATGPPTILFIELNVRACKYCGPCPSSTLCKTTEAIPLRAWIQPDEQDNAPPKSPVLYCFPLV